MLEEEILVDRAFIYLISTFNIHIIAFTRSTEENTNAVTGALSILSQNDGSLSTQKS
jgi:hypothetical protein